MVEERVEGEREVARGEDDEVEVAKEKQGFGHGGAEAEALGGVVSGLDSGKRLEEGTYGLLMYSSQVT